MESLFNQMAEFIKMEEELPFAEFQSYYTSVMAFLQKEYQDLTVDDLLKAKGILSIMGANAKTRALVKNENRKKFQKMAEKSRPAPARETKARGFGDKKIPAPSTNSANDRIRGSIERIFPPFRCLRLPLLLLLFPCPWSCTCSHTWVCSWSCSCSWFCSCSCWLILQAPWVIWEGPGRWTPRLLA